MAALDPVKVIVQNLTAADSAEIEVPNIQHIPEKGTHKVYFDPSDLYIDASDFKEVYIHVLCVLV